MKIRGVAIADIHFGIRQSKEMYDSLSDKVLTYISDIGKDLDFVNIDGDYFHKKLTLTEQSGKLALDFFDRLAKLCSENNVRLRVIKGTESHDLSQLDNFKHYEKELDCKIITKLESEDFGEFKVLYMPEEYPENYGEYMARIENNAPYDIVHGHGMWSFASFGHTDNNSGYHSAPTFLVQDFKELVTGPVIFGHIHNRMSNSNKVYYTGSYWRWAFGEDAERGFIDYTYDTDTKEYSVTYVNNGDAPSYVTIVAKDALENGMEIPTLITVIRDAAKDSHLRVSLDGLEEAQLALITESLSGNENIKFDKKVSGFGLSESDEKNDDDYLKRFGYIVYNELPLADTIQRYCREELGKEIPLEKIEKLIVKQ